jgi:rhodanese-related sulfurtransferase
MTDMSITLNAMRAYVADPRVVIVDVLAPSAYAAAHLPGAINIPLAELRERAPAELPDRTQQIVVYCASAT